ncbi:tetratricopeptide repeat protein [Patescibacteria group bacterium]|nr:tetratricopeptide repeat protein [Patescibacteria group bacterium]
MEQISNQRFIINKILKILPLVITALMPVFFLPTTTEFFEMNKLALLIVGTILMSVLLTLKIVSGDKIRFVKSIIDLPLWAYGLVLILATVFSINKTQSIYGGYGRWFPSLLAFLGLLAYFYLSTYMFDTKKDVKNALYVLLGGVSISVLVALLAYFKIYMGTAAYMKVPGFTLAGSTTTTAVLAGIGVGLSIALLAYENKKSRSYLLIGATTVNLLYVVLVSITPGWVALVTSLLGVATYVNLQKFAEKRSEMIALAGTLLAVVFTLVLPTTRDLIKNKQYPKELVLPLRESWMITSSITRDFPLLGTGPSTFNLNFPRYRPAGLNQGDLWNTRFDKAHNEILNMIGGLGLLGLLSLIFMGSRVLKLVNGAKSIPDDSGINAAASVIILSIGASFFVTYATVLTAFIIFSAFSYIVAANAIGKDKLELSDVVVVNFAQVSAVSSLGELKVAQESYTKYIVAVPLLLVTGYFGYLNYRNYMAEVYMRSAMMATATDAAKSYELQGKAINMNPQRDIYHTTYAQTNLALANVLAAKGADLTDADRKTIQTLISQSIRSARIATEIINPLNVSNWETRAVIYRSLVNVANNAADWAVRSYNNAIQLDPTNARLRLNLGGIYYAAGDYLSAANQFRQATALKNNYANAYYNFAQALKQLKNYPNAIAALEITKNLVGKNSSDFQKVENELAQLRSQPQVAGAQATKPSVEEIAGTSVEETAPANQPPLTNTGEQVTKEGELNLEQLPPREQPIVEGQPQPTVTPTPTPAE